MSLIPYLDWVDVSLTLILVYTQQEGKNLQNTPKKPDKIFILGQKLLPVGKFATYREHSSGIPEQ